MKSEIPVGTVQKRLDRARRVLDDEVRGLVATAEQLDDSFSRSVELVLSNSGKMLLCGVGKSGVVARKVAATLNSTGTPAVYLSPVDALHGDLGVVQRNDLLLLFSRSGDSEEVAAVLRGVAARGVKAILVTAVPSSSLAQLVEVVLPIADEKEACALELAPTTSTTSMIALGDALAIVLMEERGFKSEDFARNHPSGSLGKRLTMRLEDLMVFGAALPVVEEHASFKDIVLEISEKRLGSTLVLNGDKLSGIITDGDLRRAFVGSEDFLTMSASDMMTSKPMSAHPDMQAVDGLRLLERTKRGHLPVVSPDGVVVGLVHIHHLVEAGL